MLPICTKGMLYIGFYVKLFTCIISFNCNNIIRCAPFYLLYRWGNQSVEGFWNLLSSHSGEQESSVRRQCQYFYLVHWPRNMGGTRGYSFLLHSIGGLAQFKEICQDCSRICPLRKFTKCLLSTQSMYPWQPVQFSSVTQSCPVLLAVQGTLKILLQHHSSKASILCCSAFFIVQFSHPYMTIGKTIALTRWTFVGKVMSLLFNMLSVLVIAFLPRSKCLLISWLQSPSTVILEPKKIKSVTISIVSPSICHEVIGPVAIDLSFLNVEL